MKRLNRYTFSYWYFRLVKQSGTPESLARGVGAGVFVGFFIPFGGQMVSAWILAFFLRGAKIPAMAATWVTNYFTIPIIYPVLCYFGSVVLGAPLNYQRIKKVFDQVLENPSFNSFLKMGQEFIVPFLVGGFIVGVVTGVFSYFASYGLIQQYHKQRKKRLNKRLAEAAKRTVE